MDPQASHTMSVKVRLDELWFISGLVCLFVRSISLGYNAVWSCRLFRSQKMCQFLCVGLGGWGDQKEIIENQVASARGGSARVSLVLVVSRSHLNAEIVSHRFCEMLVGARELVSRETFDLEVACRCS